MAIFKCFNKLPIFVGMMSFLALSYASAAPTTPATPVTISKMTSSGFTVSWGPSTESGGSVTSYQAWFGNTAVSVAAPATTVSFTGLTMGSTQNVGVRAVDNTGNWSALTPLIAVTVGAGITPPSTPGAITASQIQTQGFTVSWSPSTDPYGVASYELWVGNTAYELAANVNRYSVSNLSAGTAYNVAVRARDAAGNLSALTPVASVHTSPFRQRGEDLTDIPVTSTSPQATNCNTTQAIECYFLGEFQAIVNNGGNSAREFIDIPAPVNGQFSISADTLTQLGYLFQAAETEDAAVVANHVQNPSDARQHFNLVIVLSFAPAGAGSVYWPSSASSPAATTLTSSENSMVGVWQTIASQFKGQGPQVWYDLLNEPVPNNNGSIYADATATPWSATPSNANVMWKTLAHAMAQGIHSVDSTRGLIVEPALWGSPAEFQYFGAPLADTNVVYSMHFYTPYSFTHQVVDKKQTVASPFPPNGLNPSGTAAIDPASDISYLSEIGSDLAAVDTWQGKWGYPIYVGEFSAVRYAPLSAGSTTPSAYNWLQYMIGQFEARDWSWDYHQYLGDEAWDVDIPSVYGPSSAPSNILLSTWEANYFTIPEIEIWPYSCTAPSSQANPTLCPTPSHKLLNNSMDANLNSQ